MTVENQEIMKQYPIFKIRIPEICSTEERMKSCGVSDIKMDMVGIKELKESYISQYHCSTNGFIINAIAGSEIAPTCEINKFPLDAFVITKSGMKGDPNSYEDEEMPAIDYCSLKDERTNEYAIKNCGILVHGFPYTDEMNGYKLIPLTDENRDEIYAEFKEKGFLHEDSQVIMKNYIRMKELNDKGISGAQLSSGAVISNALLDDQAIRGTQIKDGAVITAKLSADANIVGIADLEETQLDPSKYSNKEEAQTWSEYASLVIDAGVNMVGAMVDCVMDLPHCLDMQ